MLIATAMVRCAIGTRRMRCLSVEGMSWRRSALSLHLCRRPAYSGGFFNSSTRWPATVTAYRGGRARAVGALLRLDGAEYDPSSVELLRVRLVRGSAEDVNHAAHPHILEAGGPDDLQVLLDEECSRNSTCP